MSTDRAASSHAAAGVSIAAIVSAALDVIAEVGVAGLTMRAVAERLEVRAPTLYYHVRNKDELLQMLARDALASFDEDREAYDRVQTLPDWIALTTSGTLRLRRFYAGHPGLAALIQSTATPGREQGGGARAALVRAQIDALVRLGVPLTEARKIFETSARWTMAAVAADNVAPTESKRNDALFRRGLEWLMHGLLADAQRQSARRAKVDRD